MNGVAEPADELVFEFELDEPPEKVWRAVSIAELRERWLPDVLLSDPEPVSSVPGEKASFSMQDDDPPFLRSTVTFEVRPTSDGGTLLRIIHELADARAVDRGPVAANSNGSCLMRAA